MSGFELKEDDVIAMDEVNDLIESKTSTVEDIMISIRDALNNADSNLDEWLNGVECRVLEAKGGGWQKGKAKFFFRLEFTPDEPNPCIVAGDLRSQLDDLQSRLDLE